MARRAATNVLTEAEAADLLLGLKQPSKTRSQTPGRQKYGARAVEIDGIKFASQVEARRYQELRLRELAGEIKDLEPHPRFVFEYGGVRIGAYTADSSYVNTATSERVVEDVKSGPTRTTAYRLRKRMMRAFFGIEVQEYEEHKDGGK
jgi:hypothetical protein